MPLQTSTSESFQTFGDLLRFLRRRERLTQLELSIAVGYSEAQIGRLENNQRRPDLTALQALFIPALHLEDDPVLCARLLELAESESLEAPISKPTSPTNLPVSLTSFIGREKEQGEIVNLLSKHRLVTLAGVGGIGKTRLSLQVGQNLLSEYPDGVWFVALDSLSEPGLVPQTVAAVFGIREGSFDQPLIERLIFSLRPKTTLLIFDNCEHLLDACAKLITALLQNCPNLKALVTSRETLNIEGEATYSMPSLSMPEHDMSLEELGGYESIQLFVERAALASSSFKFTKEDAQAVIEICRKLDGVPLAIELAAARVNILQVKEILKQLEHFFALLADDSRTTLPRHQTLRASMDWSWGLLTEAEQIFLRQLSVFAGGWTLESAQAVCNGEALGLTSALVKKSLIVVNQDSGRETRYQFHEIVRQYLREKLAISDEEKNIRTRHLKYFLRLSKQAEHALRGPAQMEWLARLNDERDNIRASLEWADETDVEAGLSVAGSLDGFWERFDIRAGSHWLARFLHKPESFSYPRARAKALHAYGTLLSDQQQFDESISVAEECLALYRTIGDRQGEVDGLLRLSLNTHKVLKDGLSLIQQALEIARSLGDVQRQANALWHLGWQDQENRFAYWEKSIELARPLGDHIRLAISLSSMGYFQVVNGNLETAQKYLNEAVALRQQFNLNPIDNLQFAYGQIALIHQDFETARACFQEAIRISIDIGSRQGYLWSQIHLGYVALNESSLSEARQLFTEGAREFQKDKYTNGVVFAFEGMAGVFTALNETKRAARLIGWTDATRKEIRDTRPKLEQVGVDKVIAACLAKMGESAFSDAYEDGKKMTMDEAVAFALNES